MLTSIGKMKILIIVSGINLFINLTLNLILIPSWGLNLGFIGAGISTLITEFISFGIVYIYYNKYINRINIFWGFHKILISTFVMSILILNINCNLLVRIVLGIVIYGICIYISRIFDSEDGKVFSSIFSYIRIKHT